MSDPVLAIDIGGTKMALALVGTDGTVLREAVHPTGSHSDAEVVYAGLDGAVRRLIDGVAADHWAIGIGSAGPVDGPAGTVSPVNIAGWDRFPVRDRVLATVVAASGRPGSCALAGDGHCVTIGEHWLGAGRGVDSMIGMILSTGVGGGAVLHNELFAGSSGNAVHIGHTSVNAWGGRCVCGSHGCVEMYARGPAMVARAREHGFTGTDGRELCDAARAGDPVAGEAIEFGMRALAAGIAQLAIDFDVCHFVVGGGVAKAGDVIFEPLRRHLADFAVLHFVSDLTVVPAELPNAGLLGAAAIALSLRGEGPIRPVGHASSLHSTHVS